MFVLTNSESEEEKLAAYDYQAAGYLVKSNLGPSYERLTALVQAYYQVVEFPSR